MSEGLERLNALDPDSARDALLRCCGSRRWAQEMLQRRPFDSEEDLHDAAEEVWNDLGAADWLQAFAQHPRIGDPDPPAAAGSGGEGGGRGSDPDAPEEWSRQEQSGMDEADDEVRGRLARANDSYIKRFGYVFLICATGKRPEEMLRSLEERMENDPATELQIAAAEQAKITRLRLDKLLSSLAD